MSCVLIAFEEGEEEREDLAVRCLTRQKLYSIERGGEQNRGRTGVHRSQVIPAYAFSSR
jgi:hypothetical protein